MSLLKISLIRRSLPQILDLLPRALMPIAEQLLGPGEVTRDSLGWLE
jgi:hypothetical protein